jgi:hypothetical protein
MKYICLFRDPGGGIQAVDFSSDSDSEALAGILGRCESGVSVAPEAKIDGLVVWPLWLIREDMSRERLFRINGKARLDEEGDAVVTETVLRRMQTEDRNDG